MRWIAMLLALMLGASGCTMIGENASLRAKNERLQREAAEAEMRAEKLQRDLDFARKHPEWLRAAQAARTAQPAAKPAAQPAARPAAVAAPRKAARSRIVLGEKEVAAEAQAAAQNELLRLNGQIASLQAEYDQMGSDSDKYAKSYNGVLDSIDASRNTVTLFDQIVAPRLDPFPSPPSEAAQARLDAAKAEEARRAEEAQAAEQEVAAKREAQRAQADLLRSTSEASAAAAAKAVQENTPPPIQVVPGVIRTPAATPAPRGGGMTR